MRIGWKLKVNKRELNIHLAKSTREANEEKKSREKKMGELLNRILSSENLRSAYERVVANKGAAGSDSMRVEELKTHLQENWKKIEEQIKMGKYKPKPVKRVEIPKPTGGVRKLGIPIAELTECGFILLA